MSGQPDRSKSGRASLAARLRAAGCVYAEEEAAALLDAAGEDDLDRMVRRREAGHPLEHVLGFAELSGVRVVVTDGVFVPRRRSELLVSLAGREGRPGGVLVELCCGSGALALAVARALIPAEVHAADLDPVAVRCATKNLEPLGGQVHRGDLYAALPRTLRGRVDVLVVSPPYVPSEEVNRLPREARLHEPRLALDGGPDGMTLARRVVEGAVDWLTLEGRLFVECSADQAEALVRHAVRSLLAGTAHHDEAADATVVVVRPA